MNLLRRSCAVWAVVLALTDVSYGESSLGSPAIQKINALFADCANTHAPGYAIGIVRDGHVLYAKGYGLANLDDEVPITSETVFHLASLSKQFTAAALVLLIEDGKVALTDPVEKYVPEAHRYGPELQIRHLAYMTSGLVEYTDVKRANGTPWFSDFYFDIDDAVAASLSQPLQFEPGLRWGYRNINFMLIAKIVENVSGQSLHDFLQSRMFAPLQMHATILDDDTTQVIPHRAIGYAQRTPEIVSELAKLHFHATSSGKWVRLNRISPHYGGSGIFSSVQDLAKWHDNFEHPVVGGKQFGPLMYRTERFSHDKVNDALGLVWREYRGLKMLDYSGEDLDTNTYMAHFPGSHVGVICLSNLLHGDCEDRAKAIMEVLFDDKLL